MSGDGTLPPAVPRTCCLFTGRYWRLYTTHCLQREFGKSTCNSADPERDSNAYAALFAKVNCLAAVCMSRRRRPRAHREKTPCAGESYHVPAIFSQRGDQYEFCSEEN